MTLVPCRAAFAVALLVSRAFAAGPDSTAAPADTGAAIASAARAESTFIRLHPFLGSASGLVRPAGVAVDVFGRVLVSDAALHRVQRFAPGGEGLDESGTLGSDEGGMRSPGSVAALGASGMAVLDRENRRVVVLDLFGRRIGIVLDLAAPELERETGRIDPGMLAADRGGALFVTDPARERVLVFDSSGRFLRGIGGFGTRPGLLSGLAGLAVTPRGELVISERGNARVQILDAGGRPVASWPLPRRSRAFGALPVAVDAAGRVAVADGATGTVWWFDARGRRLGALAGLHGPVAMAFASDGSLLIAETEPAGVRRATLEQVGDGESAEEP